MTGPRLKACDALGHRFVALVYDGKPMTTRGYVKRCVRCGVTRPAALPRSPAQESVGILQPLEPVYRRKRGR